MSPFATKLSLDERIKRADEQINALKGRGRSINQRIAKLQKKKEKLTAQAEKESQKEANT